MNNRTYAYHSFTLLIVIIWLCSTMGVMAQSVPAQISALQSQVASMQTMLVSQQAQIVSLQANHALLLGPFVNVDPNPEIGVIGPNIVFSGANIHIISG